MFRTKTKRHKTKNVGFESLECRALLAADALLVIEGEAFGWGNVSAASVEIGDPFVFQEAAHDVRGNPEGVFPEGVFATRAKIAFAPSPIPATGPEEPATAPEQIVPDSRRSAVPDVQQQLLPDRLVATAADFKVAELDSSPEGHGVDDGRGVDLVTPPLAAEAEPANTVAPWQNPRNPFDVNDDGDVSPIDALLIINRLNSTGSGPLPSPTSENGPPPYLDVNGDNFLSPHDALLVINRLNSLGSDIIPEGEGAGGGSAERLSAELVVPLPETRPSWQSVGTISESSRSERHSAAETDRAAVLEVADLPIEGRRLDLRYLPTSGEEELDRSIKGDRLEEILSEIVTDIGAAWGA